MEEEILMKFPVVLRDKLLKKEITFPDETEFEYEKIKTYRAVERKTDDFSEITLADFKSYFELGKKPKKPRGSAENLFEDPHYYGVSSFLKKEIVEQIMNFPNPKKKMAEGYVYSEGGPQHTVKEKEHVCWWLYENADVSGFILVEAKK